MSINDIAVLAGVSIGTVDRVLHKRGRVAKDTYERITRIIQETGYEPNVLARQLKMGIPHKVGVLIPDTSTESGYWKAMLDGMEDAVKTALKGFAFSTEVFPFNRRDRSSLANAWDEMCISDACAYIIAPVMQEETLCLLNGAEHIKPYCFVDTRVPQLHPICEVGQDPYQAGRAAARVTYIASSRSGMYAVINTDGDAYNLSERTRGFLDWMKENNHEAVVVHCAGEAAVGQAVDEAVGMGKSGAPLSGVCVASASTHIAAARAAERGLRGEGVSVVGFDLVEQNIAAVTDGTIDCLISQKPHEQGRIAIMQIYRNILLGESEEAKVDIPINVYFKENMVGAE